MRLNKITLRNRKQVVLEYDTTTVPTTVEKKVTPISKVRELKEGTWYRNKKLPKSLVRYSGNKFGSYGFNNAGGWTTSYGLRNASVYIKEATYEDVKDNLVQECKKRFSEDERFRCLEDSGSFRFGRSVPASYSIKGDYLYIGFGKIYEKGKWASTY